MVRMTIVSHSSNASMLSLKVLSISIDLLFVALVLKLYVLLILDCTSWSSSDLELFVLLTNTSLPVSRCQRHQHKHSCFFTIAVKRTMKTLGLCFIWRHQRITQLSTEIRLGYSDRWWGNQRRRRFIFTVLKGLWFPLAPKWSWSSAIVSLPCVRFLEVPGQRHQTAFHYHFPRIL